MNTKEFIKVTTADGNVSIIPAANKDFYLRTGAKIEQPTEDELAEKVPEIKAETDKVKETEKRLGFEIIKRDKAIATMEEEIATIEAENEKLKAENTELRELISTIEAENEKLKAENTDKKDTKSSKPKTTK